MADYKRTPDPVDTRADLVKDKALGKHDDHPGVADHVGEAAGGISGVVAGAAVGSAAGPIGTIIGGIVGAMGGWWTGRAASEAATAITSSDDAYYRRQFESSRRSGNLSYDDVKPAYYLGHMASRNPDYRNSSFSDIEGELKRGWSTDRNRGSWDEFRSYANEGFSRGRSTVGNVAKGFADKVDDTKDRMDGNPASKPGPDRTDRPQRFN